MAGKGNKKNKNQKPQETTTSQQNQFTQEQIINMAQQKLNELDNKPYVDSELAVIRKEHQDLLNFVKSIDSQSNLSQDDKTKVFDYCLTKLIDIGIEQEKQLILSTKIQNIYQTEIEVGLQEQQKLQQLKLQFQNGTKDLNGNISYGKQQIKELKAQEELKREELSTNFQNSIGDIEQKMKDQKAEGEEVQKENVELKKQLDEKIKQYEERQLEFQNQNGSEEQKSKTEEFMEKIKQLEEQTKLTIQSRQKQHELRKNENEKKLQLFLFQKKFQEYTDSLDKTQQMLVNFQQELIKQSLKLEKIEKENQLIKQNEVLGDKTLVDVFQKNEEIRNQIQSIQKLKDNEKQEVLQLQNELKTLK